MRTLITLVSLSLLVPLASADSTPRSTKTPAVNLAPIDETTIPNKCKPMARQVSSPALPQALAARVSLASCLADAKLSGLALLDCQDSIVAVDEATSQSFALLDEVGAAGDDVMKVIAEHAKGELYSAMAVRMLDTVQSPRAGADEATLALYTARKGVLEMSVTPWREKANAAYQLVIDVAKANPQLAKNPVVQTAIKGSQLRLTAKVATAD